MAQPTATLGALQGSVTDEQGRPLAGAEVRYRRLFRTVPGAFNQLVPAPGEAVVQSKVLTDTSGAYTLLNLPAGEYVLCGSVPAQSYLDPCSWATPPLVTIAANASTKHVFVLTKGVFLRVRINDPSKLLPQLRDGPGHVNLVVGVKFRNGAFLGADNVGIDASGRDYQMPVAAGEPLKLWLFSRHLSLLDARGTAVDVSGGLIPFQPALGTDQTFAYTVSQYTSTLH